MVDTQTLNVLHAGELLTILFVSLSTVLEGKQAIERSLHVYELCNIASARLYLFKIFSILVMKNI